MTNPEELSLGKISKSLVSERSDSNQDASVIKAAIGAPGGQATSKNVTTIR